MWWLRRRGTPIWVWILAWLGFKSLWSWQVRAQNPDFTRKQEQFRSKINEAFDVWRKPSEDRGDEVPEA